MQNQNIQHQQTIPQMNPAFQTNPNLIKQTGQ